MRIGSLFSGYGGLDMAVAQVTGATVAWHCEIEPAPVKILAHHWPDVPNLGDITTVNWADVEPVDIITGGSPCQDLSHAGKRGGMSEGTRSNLWVQMREAIAALQPRLVVWENVRGALSAPADSDLEPCPLCVGDRSGATLRALGRVVGDLSELGHDAQWTGLRAADVGAPHGRYRIFLTAWPAADAPGHGRHPWWAEPALRQRRPHAALSGDPDVTLLPTPVADNSRGLPSASTDYASLANAVVNLLPTPAVNDMGRAYTPEQWDAWTERMRAEHGNGNGHWKSLEIEAARTAEEQILSPHIAMGFIDWGDYAPAIARWERVLGRSAPSPTEPTGRGGSHRLSARFTEWLMGLPEGHVTGVPGLTRNQQLKALGNGVVPQQATAALTHLLTLERTA